MQQQQQTKDGFILQLRIVWFAMIQSVIVFAGVMWFIGTDGKADSEIFKYIGVGFATLMVVLHIVVPRIIRGSVVNQIDKTAFDNTPDEDKWKLLRGAYRSGKVVALALLEGGCFMSILMWFIGGDQECLMAAAGLLAFLALQFPVAGKFDDFVENQRQLIQLQT